MIFPHPILRPILPRLLACVAGVATLLACHGDDPVSPESRVATIHLADTRIEDTLTVADTLTLRPVISDAAGNAVSGARVRWSSSSGAAVVDSTGKVTALALGRATIRFESGSARDSVTFTVVRLDLGDGVGEMLVGDTTRLHSMLATGSGESDVPVEWTSTDTMTLRVDDSGLVTGAGFGSAAVVASWAGPHGVAVDTQTVAVGFYTVPVPVPLVSVTVGAAQACGLTADGQAWCWGTAPIPGVGAHFGDQRWQTPPGAVSTDARFTRLDAGFDGTCGWTTSGEVLCWGSNSYQALAPDLAPNAWLDAPRPVNTSLRFPGGGLHSQRGQTCGIADDATAYCWGYNAFGTLGHATVAPSSDTRIDTSFTAVDGGHRFRALDGDGYAMCGADLDGAVWCWGSNANVLTDVSGGQNMGRARGSIAFEKLAVSYLGAACGLTSAGDAYCWGMNDVGQLGVGGADSDTHLEPELVAGSHRWQQLAAGGASCGITIEGKLYCWGAELGFRGLDTTRPQPVASSLTFRSVDVSYWSSALGFACAVTADGAVYCFDVRWPS